MLPGPADKHPPGSHAVLVGYLGRGGITITYAPLDGDARWHATTRTLILREDASPRIHLEILRDLIDMTTYGYRSHLGATPRRHLHAVPA